MLPFLSCFVSYIECALVTDLEDSHLRVPFVYVVCL